MKKILLNLLLFVSFISYAQVSTSPGVPTSSDLITITFNATGTNLEGYTGDVYAHTGVLTDSSTDNSDWKHTIGTWGNNTTQPKLTRTGTNTYQLIISPNLISYYNINTGETVTDLAFVFRSADGNSQTSPDIFITIYATGLNVAITNPANNTIYNLNDNITISAESSINANLELKVNNSSIQTATNTTLISSSYTFSNIGSNTIKATAEQGGEIKTKNISVYVKTSTITATKPSGLKYGVNINPDNTVTFLLQAPLKTDVFLLGDFNNWTLDAAYQLAKDGDDFWITLPGLDMDTEYAYQYLIDYNIKIADPYSTKILDPNNDQYIPTITYPNLKPYPTNLTTGIVSTFQINEPSYTWQTTNFTKPDEHNLVVYELLLRDFTVVNTNDIGDLKTALTKLNYLKNLGINAIELMPVSEFEGNDSWGYNPSFHGALDKAYGTKNDLKQFVDECHSKGIAVILDVVYNHAFGQSPLAQMYWDSTNNRPATNSPYFNAVATHPYSVGNDFNHESPYAKTYVKQTLKHWVTEFKVDGFRFDLSKGFTQTVNTDVGAWGNYDASRIAILEDYANDIWTNTANDEYLILEHFSDNSEETELANFGFMLWGNNNHNYNQNTMGWSTDDDLSGISYKNKGWNNPNLVGYMESHDEERLMYRNLQFGNSYNGYNVQDINTALERQELVGLFFITIPGPKMIWQFGELGYDISIDYNGRAGRKPIHWEYFDDVNRKNIYTVWSKLAKLKNSEPVFKTTNFNLDTGGLVKRIELIGNTDKVIIIGNFDVVTQTKNPAFSSNTTWYELFSNTSISVNDSNKNTPISLAPGEYKMYSTKNLSATLNIDDQHIALNKFYMYIYPNPVTNSFKLSEDTKLVEIFDSTGKLVKSFDGNFTRSNSYDITNLSKTLYFVKIITKKGVNIKRLIKQ